MKKSKLFNQASSFTRSLGEMFVSLDETSRSCVLDRMHTYAKNTYHQVIQANYHQILLGSENRVDYERIKYTIQPIFHTIFLSFAFFFYGICFTNDLNGKKGEDDEVEKEPMDPSNTLTSQQSVQVLDTFSYLYYCHIDFPVYQLVLKKNASNLIQDKQNLEALARLLPTSTSTTTPATTLEPEPDDSFCTRTQYFLQISQMIIYNFPVELLKEKIIPWLFKNIQHHDRLVSSKAHRVFGCLFSRKGELQVKLVPHYVETSLSTYPEKADIKSLMACFAIIAKQLPPSNSVVVLYMIEMLADHAAKMLTKGSTRTGGIELMVLLFKLITVVDIQILKAVLDKVESVIVATDKSISLVLCKHLYKVISSNYDYVRKDECVRWYLSLSRKLQLTETLASSIAETYEAAMHQLRSQLSSYAAKRNAMLAKTVSQPSTTVASTSSSSSSTPSVTNDVVSQAIPLPLPTATTSTTSSTTST
eukprot:TRINITY_DN6136_c0_g1_i1.p1 TRINITY_DN6136_c0_g1~~TRINITY_DN6136_c0_g1_i1.p1  ORF type:complete len:507 (+),score=137.45 TRINITY_DN6136_c0_g1_i1:95-1522(+)